MTKLYPPSADFAAHAHIDKAKYDAMYAASVADPNAFWAEHGKRIDWIKPFSKVKNTTFAYPDVSIKWFEDGELNVSANCIDRHLATRGDQTAIIWEADDPNISKHITYLELSEQVNKFANVLKSQGVKKGDRVILYMPMIPEAAYAMLACARVGAVHSIVFAGFSPDALASRISDCGATLVITADEAPRGGKNTPLKVNVDKAMAVCGDVKTLVVERTGGSVPMKEGRDIYLHTVMAHASTDCPPEVMGAEDPLFILYTSGSTGKPKGVLHTSGGYLVWASMTHEYVFDYHDGDIYWCTADVGWVTGHSYIVYGPLANGATTLMFEGVPSYPDFGRFWAVCEKHKVNQFYTAPTAIRALMAHGPDWVNKHDLSSLKVLGTVGEPINPEAWNWYNDVVGKGNCPIVDTWWQTETGAIMISPLPGVTATKPGSAMSTIPGISAKVVDDSGTPVPNGHGGFLILDQPWPSMLRGIWGEDERYKETYWSRFKGIYFAGDGAKLDEEGAIWLMGRVDDVMNVSGHRISTTEVESALVSHEAVAEAAVVGAADEMTGQGIVAFVILRGGIPNAGGEELIKQLRAHVTKEIGAIARPRQIMVVAELPKTRSGKIMRRLLKDVAENRAVGDATTLADPNVMKLISEGLNSSKDED